MTAPLSCYVLTHNSAVRLHQVLGALSGIVDDLVVVDSGSTDGTVAIAEQAGARVVVRPLQDFPSQRTFAVSQCRHDWVLAVDSDEVVSPELAARLAEMKRLDFAAVGSPDAFAIRRDWYVFGRRVRCFYPSRCPDFPVRLFRRGKGAYTMDRPVHETMRGFNQGERIDEPLMHYTCDTGTALYGKMDLYTTLASRELRRHGRPSLLRLLLVPWLVWLRWYVFNGGWRDGELGLVLARYAQEAAHQKHVKARYE